MASRYAYIIIERQENVVKKRSYMGPDPVDNFLVSLSQAWQNIKKVVLVRSTHMTNEDEAHFQSQRKCELCFPPFDDMHRLTAITTTV